MIYRVQAGRMISINGRWYAGGEVITLPDETAVQLIKTGAIEQVVERVNKKAEK